MSGLVNGIRAIGEPASAKAPASDKAMELIGISKTFGGNAPLLGRAGRWLGLASGSAVLHAIDEVSLHVAHGEVVGLVGESGCGKSTIGRIAAGIMQPSAGHVQIDGRDVASMSRADARRAKLKAQMIFQDPSSSLNPRMTIGAIIGEAPRAHGLMPADRAAREAYVDERMTQVGIDPSRKRAYPHELSGGQRQRVGIARALAVDPDFLICDESVAALDVSVQAQILNLFMELRHKLGLSYLFISHDLGVVQHIADRVAVMYLGRVIEEGPAAEIFQEPNHPYTRGLLAGIPRIDGEGRFNPIKGELPSPMRRPTGCHFHPRCPHAFARCREERPALVEISPGRRSACHLNDG